MRRIAFILALLMLNAACAARVPGMDPPFEPQTHRPDAPPWVSEMVATILALVILAILVYLFRPSDAGSGSFGRADFTIIVDPPDVLFKGDFPAASEQLVIDFLTNDCRIEGRYKVMGRWMEERLVISVQGENAKPLEQRIRNFLKLNIKSPSPR